MEAFFALNQEAPLYLKEGADGEFYADRQGKRKYIGLDRDILARNRGRLRWIKSSMTISPGVHLLAEFPITYRRPVGNAALKVKQGDRLDPDPFDHEIALVTEEDDGITIFTGCGHSGVLNIVSAAKTRFPAERIKAVIGGFHQMAGPERSGLSSSTDEVRQMGLELVRLGCVQIYGGHCTGHEASQLLQDELGDVYHELHTGLIFDV